MAEDTDYTDNTDSYEYTEYTQYTDYTGYTEYDNYTEDRGKNICFAVLVHNRREVVIDLLDNIRCYNPNSSIVLYNGGNDPDLCKGLEYPVCPTSRKLSYGVTAIYMLEVMRWLEDINERYDYLINLDSDVLFSKEGFEDYIINEMKDKDYLGVGTKVPDDDFYCLHQLRQESAQWEPLLGQEPYYEAFNVGQVYSRSLVRRMLTNDKYDQLYKNLRKTKAFGVDELVYATMVDRLGTEIHSYKKEVAITIRYRPHFHLDEVIGYLNREPNCYLFHPIYRRMEDESRCFIREAMRRDIQTDPDIQQQFISKNIGLLPYMIRRSRYNGMVTEWLSASEQGGLLYWKVKSGVLYGPYAFGSGEVKAITALESRHGNIEAVCRIDNYLVHFWRDENTGEWHEYETFAEGVTGMPSFLESSYGNYEVVAPLKNGGLGHWWRNNEDSAFPWFGPTLIGEGDYDDVILIENDSNQLTSVSRQGDEYKYFVRDDRNSWLWFGPYD